ncbi:MAG: L,D-transpeptidase family protein [Rhizobiaceae bacterium]|nr:L,D-transpeptidase family protein [Rhizobiaceae bacterium]
MASSKDSKKPGSSVSFSRRKFLGAAATIGAGGLASAPALAQQSPLDLLLKFRKRGSWNDQFDSRNNDGALSSSNVPVFSSQTPGFIEASQVEYRDIVARGGWPVVPANKKLKLGRSSSSIQILRKRLKVSGDLSANASESNVYDSWVEAAVRRFQARHGLPADGVMGRYSFAAMNIPASVRLGQLDTNLIRLRSMSGNPGDRYVMVNIPAIQIEAVDGDRVALRHTAIVGKIDRQTPILNSKIHEVIFNPYWTSPVSIIRKDIIPAMRKDNTYLARNKIRLFSYSTGEEVPAESVDWSGYDAVKYKFRQDPGKINAMASAKINFPNPHAVYMHDTPDKALFGNITRFNSSGCIRVQNVRDLVTWILRDTPQWSRQNIEAAIATGQSTPVRVAQAIPVYLTYVTAWSTQKGVTQFRNDIYRRDGVEQLALK